MPYFADRTRNFRQKYIGHPKIPLQYFSSTAALRLLPALLNLPDADHLDSLQLLPVARVVEKLKWER